MPAPRGRDQWVHLAEQRILRVLKARTAANIRQLEVKICESGPAGLRPEPGILQEALKNLLASKQLRVIKPKGIERHEEAGFYTLAPYYPQPAQARVDELLVHYRLHRWLTESGDLCARVLEDIVSQSFAAAAGYTSLGNLPKGAPLDGAYEVASDRLGVEVKNVREWIYPMSGEVWVMVRKCLEIDAVPFLVSRKTSFYARSVFRRLGILSFEVFRQYFSHRVAHLLGPIRHTDLLGYKDVVAVQPQPNPYLVAFLNNTVPRELAYFRDRWDARYDLLYEFAVTRKLGNPDMSDQQRERHFEDFKQALYEAERAEEGEGEEPDFPDDRDMDDWDDW